jgi:N-acetylmuramoyl-L-alanine amidase
MRGGARLAAPGRLRQLAPARKRLGAVLVAAAVAVPTHAAAAAHPWTPLGRAGPIPYQQRACLAFRPLGRWNGHTVFVDPGHGGIDPGGETTVGNRTVVEKQVTLALGMRALALLRATGYRVVISRSADSTVAQLGPGDVSERALTPDALRRDVAARNLCADAAHADVLIAIHLNAAQDPSAAGIETIYCPVRRFGPDNGRLATAIQRSELASLRSAGPNVRDRGTVTDSAAGTPVLSPQGDAYGHLLELGPATPSWLRYPSLMPGVVAETLFLTNRAEARIALSAAGQLAIARGLALGLKVYFRAYKQG